MSKEKSKSKSSKSEKHSSHSSSKSTAKIGEAMKAVFALVVKKPKHYTKKRLASKEKLGEKFGGGVVRAAIASLKEQEKIASHRIDGGRGKKGNYVLFPLVKKAA
jgi:hypothetical protein